MHIQNKYGQKKLLKILASIKSLLHTYRDTRLREIKMNV